MFIQKVFTAVLVFVFIMLAATACRKAPQEEEAINANIKKAEQAAAAAGNPYFQQGPRGDIERAGVSVMSAQMALQQKNYQEAATELKKGLREIDAALSKAKELKHTFMQSSLEETKAAMERTINSAQQQKQETASQISELQTRIGALKVNFPLAAAPQ